MNRAEQFQAHYNHFKKMLEGHQHHQRGTAVYQYQQAPLRQHQNGGYPYQTPAKEEEGSNPATSCNSPHQRELGQTGVQSYLSKLKKLEQIQLKKLKVLEQLSKRKNEKLVN